MTNTSAKHNAKVNGQRHEMNLVKPIERFGSEDRCRDYLEVLRWPDGVRCTACGSDSISRITTRNQFDCNACRNRFSVKSGTVFHDSHLPLWKWFLATYLMTESRKGISANQLKRTLAVSYKTAWYLCHRVRWAMSLVDRPRLNGTVEADETYVGGKATGFKTKQDAARGRMRNKTIVLGAIQRDGDLRLQVVKDAGSETVKAFFSEHIGEDAEAIYTDAHRSYREAHGEVPHSFVDHSADEWVRGDVHTNSIESAWSLFDRAVVGAYHQLSKKHLPAYLAEFEFRFNNRENPFLFRDTLTQLVSADPLTYRELTQPDHQPQP